MYTKSCKPSTVSWLKVLIIIILYYSTFAKDLNDHCSLLPYCAGNILYPLKVCGKPESEDDHTVTLFYAVPIAVEGVCHSSIFNESSQPVIITLS